MLKCDRCKQKLKETDFYKKDLINKAFRNEELYCKSCKGIIAHQKWYAKPENKKRMQKYNLNYAKTEKGKEVRRKANKKYLEKKKRKKIALQRATEINEID